MGTLIEYEQLRITLNYNTDENDVIRSYGRMKYAKIPDETNAPILLSREHRLNFLVVWYLKGIKFRGY